MNCLNCGKTLSGRSTKYCNNKCQMDYQHKQWVERWKNGEETGLKGKYQVSDHLRRYLKRNIIINVVDAVGQKLIHIQARCH